MFNCFRIISISMMSVVTFMIWVMEQSHNSSHNHITIQRNTISWRAAIFTVICLKQYKYSAWHFACLHEYVCMPQHNVSLMVTSAYWWLMGKLVHIHHSVLYPLLATPLKCSAWHFACLHEYLITQCITDGNICLLTCHLMNLRVTSQWVVVHIQIDWSKIFICNFPTEQ